METLGEFIQKLSEEEKSEIINSWELSGYLKNLNKEMKYFVGLAGEQAILAINLDKEIEKKEKHIFIEILPVKIYGENFCYKNFVSKTYLQYIDLNISEIFNVFLKDYLISITTKLNDYNVINFLSMYDLLSFIKCNFKPFLETVTDEDIEHIYNNGINIRTAINLKYITWISEKYSQLVIK